MIHSPAGAKGEAIDDQSLPAVFFNGDSKGDDCEVEDDGWGDEEEDWDEDDDWDDDEPEDGRMTGRTW